MFTSSGFLVGIVPRRGTSASLGMTVAKGMANAFACKNTIHGLTSGEHQSHNKKFATPN
jgi:hypothetical protein